MSWRRRRADECGLAGVLVSIVLTSTEHRRHSPRSNRRIPTIPAVRIDHRPVDVRGVDTGLLAGTTPRGLDGGAGHLWPLLPHLAPVPAPGGTDATPAPTRAPSSGRPTPRGRGSTGQGLCVLYESPTYVEYTRTSSSSTPPWCIAPRRRREPPGRLHPASGAGSGSRAWETGPTGVLRCHDIRNSQKS